MEPSSGPDHSSLSHYSRDDKRYTEKKNKSERARRKKEDTARLRNIVDVALSADPRIKRIKQEEKDAREAKRKTKTGPGAGLSKTQAEEEKRRAEEEAKAKEEAEKVNLLHRSKCPFLTDDLCRLRKQRQRRRRLQLPMPRRKHAALRELKGPTIRNSEPCQVAAPRTIFHLVPIASYPLTAMPSRTCRASVHGKPRTYDYAMYG